MSAVDVIFSYKDNIDTHNSNFKKRIIIAFHYFMHPISLRIWAGWPIERLINPGPNRFKNATMQLQENW